MRMTPFDGFGSDWQKDGIECKKSWLPSSTTLNSACRPPPEHQLRHQQWLVTQKYKMVWKCTFHALQYTISYFSLVYYIGIYYITQKTYHLFDSRKTTKKTYAFFDSRQNPDAQQVVYQYQMDRARGMREAIE